MNSVILWIKDRLRCALCFIRDISAEETKTANYLPLTFKDLEQTWDYFCLLIERFLECSYAALHTAHAALWAGHKVFYLVFSAFMTENKAKGLQ